MSTGHRNSDTRIPDFSLVAGPHDVWRLELERRPGAQTVAEFRLGRESLAGLMAGDWVEPGAVVQAIEVVRQLDDDWVVSVDLDPSGDSGLRVTGIRLQPLGVGESLIGSRLLRRLGMADLSRGIADGARMLAGMIPASAGHGLTPRRPGAKPNTDGWYAQKAAEWLRALEESPSRPQIVLARRFPDVPAKRWYGWLKAATDRGLFERTETRRGYPANGHLTKKGNDALRGAGQ